MVSKSAFGSWKLLSSTLSLATPQDERSEG